MGFILSMSQKSSLYRVLEILKRINNGEKLCVSHLAESYEVSQRSIQRDIKMINEIFNGFLFKEGECYHAQKKVILDKVLQGTELMTLCNIVNLFDLTSNKSLVSKETKKMIKNSMDVYAFKSRPIEKSYNKEILQTLEHAVKFNKELKIHYHGRYLSNQILRIQPYKLVFSVDNLYLIAFSPKEEKIRKFRFSNIEAVHEISKSFYKNRDIDNYITTSQTLLANDSSKDLYVRIKVNSTLSKYFYFKKYLPSQKIIQKFEDESIEVEYYINNFLEIESLIIKWLPNVKILEPKALNEFMKEKVGYMLKGFE